MIWLISFIAIVLCLIAFILHSIDANLVALCDIMKELENE
jgi:hypothetical protein